MIKGKQPFNIKANSVHLDEATHREPTHLELHFLPSSHMI